MYLLMYLILFFGTLISFSYNISYKLKEKIFIICIFLMTLLLCFRYGQGTDYKHYMREYQIISTNISFLNLWEIKRQYHSDFGYLLLEYIFKIIGLTFEGFIFFISLYMMLMLYLCINNYSNNKIFSLLLFFPTCYFIYYFSAIREALCIATFVGIMLPYLLNKNYFKYEFWGLICCCFHKVSIIFLILPLFFLLKKRLNIIIVIFYGLLGMNCYKLLYGLAEFFKLTTAYSNESFYFFSLLEKTVMLMMIYILYDYGESKNKEKLFVFNIYCFSYILALSLMYNSLISSRVGITLKCLEFILIPNLLNDCNTKQFNVKKVCTFIYVVILMVNITMYAKNIKENIDQNGYENRYPYISIFNKNDVKK